MSSTVWAQTAAMDWGKGFSGVKIDLSAESWGRVVVSTIAGTMLCVVASVYVDSFNFASMDQARLIRSVLVDIFLPVALAVPLLLFFTSKLRELAIAHRRLTVIASTDGLTQVLNRAAFSTLVDAYLHEVHAQRGSPYGALLIIDADNFKSVNDSYGHDRGDEALVTIADSIKNMLRGPDLVGRLGGEEFGVFLPGATSAQAELVAERIRTSVNEAPFAPTGARYPLSVSVGGALFHEQVQFSELFRAADQQLYAAKQAGRNRVAIAAVQRLHLPLAAA